MRRAAHLSGPAAFKAVLARPATAKTRHFVLHTLSSAALAELGALTQGNAALAVGVLVPKRLAKRAVTRNAIRRQIYAWFEAWRMSAGVDSGWFVVRLRAAFAQADRDQAATSRALRDGVRTDAAELGQRAQAQLGQSL
jgi:ribonuclease P protein component